LGLTVRPLRDLVDRRDRFDGVLYHLGNSAEFHREIYRLAWENPGIAVLHDLNIHPFLQHAYLGTPEEGLYRDALADGYGERGSRHFRDVRSGRCEPDLWSFPASRAVAARSEVTIVHSAWVREQLGALANVIVVPHGASPRRVLDEKEESAARAQVGLPEDAFVVGVFGFLNAHKRIPSVLDACRRLRARGYPVRLLLVGEVNDGRLRLSEVISEHGAETFTHRTGYVDESSYWAYLDATDLVVNLRYPSMGESSGSLFRALGSGKPCLVSDDRQFAELPDSVCWKVSTAETEVDELAAGLAQLMRDRDLRAQLGRNARRFVESYASFDRVAGLYERVVRRVMRTRSRPSDS
jgi:glycosyltransferase involved in cell wall biosynthesis